VIPEAYVSLRFLFTELESLHSGEDWGILVNRSNLCKWEGGPSFPGRSRDCLCGLFL
jgi:hypothetical protein